MASPEPSRSVFARANRAGERVQRYWQQVTEGANLEQLWKQFRADARQSYALYSREVDWESFQSKGRIRRFLSATWAVFHSMLMKLSPARRVLLLIAMILLIYPLPAMLFTDEVAAESGLLKMFVQVADRGRRRPGVGADEPARPLVMRGRRSHRVLYPGAQHRLLHDAVVDPLQPVVPPAQRFLQEPDRGQRRGGLRPGVAPRPDQSLAGTAETLQQPRDGIGVAVLPAADGVNRGRDRRVVVDHRALFPVGVAALVLQPDLGQRLRCVDAAQPQTPPAICAHHLGIRRLGVRQQHVGGPVQHVQTQYKPALVVHVVAVAVVGR